MNCGSMLGSSFRANFRMGSADGSGYMPAEVLLCSTHEAECRELRDKMPSKLIMTMEGWIVSALMYEAMGRTYP